MLSFVLHLSDFAAPSWSWSGDRWTTGRSWIKPLTNPALDWALAHDRIGGSCAVVRERLGEPVRHAAPTNTPVTVTHVGAAVDRTHELQGDYVTIEMRSGWVRVTAGPLGVAPVYLIHHDDTLIGSWHLPELRRYLSAERLLDRAVARALTRQHRYSADTLFQDVSRLTERAVATFTHARFAIDYPTPALHVMKARKLGRGMDAVEAFHRLIARRVAQVPALPNTVGIESSGGADSANVALAASAVRDDLLRSYGVLVGGDVGEHQRARRELLVAKLGLHDTEIPALPPFAPSGLRAFGIPHDPASAFYREAFDAMREAAAADGIRTMLTGLGGDEINTLRPDEHTTSWSEADPVPWLGTTTTTVLAEVDTNLAPASILPRPTLMAFGLHNPTYLMTGIWPVAPLADPPVVRFAEQLPVALRRDKRLFRQRLHRAGLPQEVTHPIVPENFSDIMQSGLRRYGLRLLKAMLQDSILIDLGYLDPDALTQAYKLALTAARVPSMLCDPIAIEVGLRSLLEPVTSP